MYLWRRERPKLTPLGIIWSHTHAHLPKSGYPCRYYIVIYPNPYKVIYSKLTSASRYLCRYYMVIHPKPCMLIYPKLKNQPLGSPVGIIWSYTPTPPYMTIYPKLISASRYPCSYYVVIPQPLYAHLPKIDISLYVPL